MLVRRILPLLLIALMLGALFVAALAAASALPVQDLAQYWAAAHLVTKNPYSLELTTSFERSAGVVSAAPSAGHKDSALGNHAGVAIGPSGLQGCICAMVGDEHNRHRWMRASSVGSLHSDTFVGSCAFVVALWAYCCDSDARSAHGACAAGHNVVPDPGRAQTGLVGWRIALARCREAPRRILFLLAVLLWILYFKRWKILVSGSCRFRCGKHSAVAINPHIYAQFMDRTRLVVHETESYPNLGGAIYAATGHHHSGSSSAVDWVDLACLLLAKASHRLGLEEPME